MNTSSVLHLYRFECIAIRTANTLKDFCKSKCEKRLTMWTHRNTPIGTRAAARNRMNAVLNRKAWDPPAPTPLREVPGLEAEATGSDGWAGVEVVRRDARVGVVALALFEPVCTEDTASGLPLVWPPGPREPRCTSAMRISRSDCWKPPNNRIR